MCLEEGGGASRPATLSPAGCAELRITPCGRVVVGAPATCWSAASVGWEGFCLPDLRELMYAARCWQAYVRLAASTRLRVLYLASPV